MDQWDITHDHGDMVGIYVVFFRKKENISYIWENHWENNDDRDAFVFYDHEQLTTQCFIYKFWDFL